ncbi:MAG: restriction endonuclease subunit S [Slackia sp.]
MGEPKLRFKADDGSDFPDWEGMTLGDVGSVAMCKRVFKEQTREVGDVPFFKIGTFGGVPDAYISKSLFDELKSKYAYPEVGTILLSASGTIGRQVEYKGEDAYYQDSNIVWLEHDDTVLDSYLKQFYSVVKWQGLEGSTIKRLYNKTILDTPFYRPSLPEQRKIADLLSTVDDVIAAQEAEVAAWEKRKKGVMQKLFSQEVRFKADDGSDFPDWESTTVGELFTFVTEKNESGRISDVITNSAEHGLIPQREYFDKDIAVEGNTEGYTVIHKGDFVYNPRKSTIAPFGPFNIYERDEVGIVSPLYTCLTPRDGETAPYLSWYFKTSRWHRYIVTHGAQGGARHDRVGMTNALMKGIPVMLPSLPEQRKIADCLTSLDDVIAKAKDELDAWRELKKGLLQQMFV